jgi:hypothetical protein
MEPGTAYALDPQGIKKNLIFRHPKNLERVISKRRRERLGSSDSIITDQTKRSSRHRPLRSETSYMTDYQPHQHNQEDSLAEGEREELAGEARR